MNIYLAGINFITSTFIVHLSSASFQSTSGGLTSWGWVLVFLLVSLIVGLALLWQTRLVEPLPSVHAGHSPEHADVNAARAESAPVAEAAAPASMDDLTIIEGIGPKISQLLQQAGINTFAQLAATPVEKLQEIMLDANLRIANPATWPEQARLAAEGKLDDLQRLQDNLKAGRRV